MSAVQTNIKIIKIACRLILSQIQGNFYTSPNESFEFIYRKYCFGEIYQGENR